MFFSHIILCVPEDGLNLSRNLLLIEQHVLSKHSCDWRDLSSKHLSASFIYLLENIESFNFPHNSES